MKPKFFAGVAIGILLIYIGFYGASAIGLQFTATTLPTHEDFNDLSGWSIVRSSASISPAGEVQIVSASSSEGGLTNQNPGSAVAGQASLTYTVTLRLKGDQWGTGTYASGFQLQMYDDAQSFWWRFWVNGSAVWGQDAVNTFVYSVVDDNAYHVYTVPVTVANDKCVFDVYRDAVKCFTGGSQVTSGGTGGSRVSLDVKSYGGGPITVHVDYLYFDAGLHPPSSNPTTYTLTISASTGGTTSPSGTQSYSAGTSASVTATAGSGYILSYWLLDGTNAGSTNPIPITMSTNHALQAIFTSSTPGTYQLTVSVNDASMGTTNPSPSTYSKSAGSTVSVTAIASGSNSFDHWMLDGANVGNTNPCSVTMGTSHSLVAVFSSGVNPNPPWDPLAGVRQFLNSISVRETELIVGSLMTIVSGIVAVVPFKRRARLPSPIA